LIRIVKNCGLVFLGGLLYHAALAQEKNSASVWDGIYTNAQAARGEQAYRKTCASCHGENLDGVGQAPALSGSEFMTNWNGKTVADLFEQIRTTMPADDPAQLGPAEKANIVAYLLQVNKFPSGSAELPPDAEPLERVRIEAQKPKK
jgi:S-disulfanyl-L-cysteine oxidoreductase SoxD